MQAIILAAGMGKRLAEYTKNNTKCMVPVNGVRLVDRVLSDLSELGLNRVVIVVGYKGKELIDYIGHRYDDKVKIEFIDNPIYDKTNNIYSLALAKEKMMEDDTILLESDLIFEKRMLNLLMNDPFPNLALVAKYESWMDGTMVRIDEDNNIINFVPKAAFKYSDIDSYYKTVNIYKFSKDFSRNTYIPFLKAYMCTLGENEYYEQVLRVISFLNHSELKALPITDEKWYEIDDKQDLDIAETIFSEGEELWYQYNRRLGGYWRFPQMINFNYLQNSYFPTRKMKDELISNFDYLINEHPSGMAVNTLLASKDFDIKEEWIVPGNGSAELIEHLMPMLNGKLGIVYPTFEEYPNRYTENDIVGFEPTNEDFHYTVDNLMEFFADKSLSNLLLVNPDNPSGNMISKRDALKLADWCKDKNIQLIVDESFIDYCDGGLDESMMNNEVLSAYSNLIIIKSISKTYGISGLRIGIMASSNEALIINMRNSLPIWNINAFAEFFMQILSKYSSDYKKAMSKLRKERNRMKEELDKIDFLRVISSQANYFLCEVTKKYTARELGILLIKNNNFFIKDCTSKRALKGKQYIRISLRNEKDDNRLLEALRDL